GEPTAVQPLLRAAIASASGSRAKLRRGFPFAPDAAIGTAPGGGFSRGPIPCATLLDDIPAAADARDRCSQLISRGSPMSITPDVKETLIKEYATKEGDTGSPEVQVAILTSRITTLT